MDVVMNELGEICDEVWKLLAEAVTDESSPWRIFSLATLGDDEWPTVRQVVLRGVGCERRELIFSTDPRTPKWVQLQVNPRAEVLFWDEVKKVQLRCRVSARCHEGDELARAYQEQMPAHLAGDFAALSIPGSRIQDAASGYELGEDWSFGVVILEVTEMDWLELGRLGHRRVRFLLQDERWVGSWVQP